MPKIVSNTIQVHIAYFDESISEYRFLILKRSMKELVYPGIWQVITGTIESNETAYKTAIREIQEEIGIQPLKVWNIPQVTSFYDYKSDSISLVPVFGIILSSSKIILSEEHDDYEWLDLNEAKEKLTLLSHKEGTQAFFDSILSNPENKIFELKP